MLAFTEHLIKQHLFIRIPFGLSLLLLFVVLFFLIAYQLFHFYFEKLDDFIPHTPRGSTLAFFCIAFMIAILGVFSFYYWHFVCCLYV